MAAYSVVTYNYHPLKAVIDASQGICLLVNLLLCGQRQCRLYVYSPVAFVAYKIYLKLGPTAYALSILAIYRHNAHINIVPSIAQFIYMTFSI